MQINYDFNRNNTNNILRENKFVSGIHDTAPAIHRKADVNVTTLKALLSKFESHGLDDLRTANLMHRVDTKFLLPISDLETLLRLLVPSYTVLEIDNARMFLYRNTYYDTPGFGFYLMHHNGKKNRFKIRIRHYVNSGDKYFEVKHKTNKSVTRKDRVLINRDLGSRRRINELVQLPFGAGQPRLFKSLACSYVRIALADEKNGERLTLDLNLSFRDPNNKGRKQSNSVLIAEVKRGNLKIPSVFMDLMNRFRQKPVSFSKYCIGCAQVHSNRVKTNRFKTTLMSLDRII